jgi:Ni/Fe-hydrogenase subunit HybB-like protein
VARLRGVRRSTPLLFILSILINIGMWYERFVIIIGGVAHDFMPNAWGTYSPTIIEYGILVGSFSMFFFLYLLFVKHLPSVSMTEMKESAHKGEGHAV